MNKTELIELESKLDTINGDYGSKVGYCIFCNSTNYNGSVGIIHKYDCILLSLREKIKSLSD